MTLFGGRPIQAQHDVVFHPADLTVISVRRSGQALVGCLVRRLSLHSRNGVGPGSV
jgi:hypothetical protein